MIVRRLGPACLLALIAASAAAQGTPRSISDCERLKNDLAYNQCLAMFGPAARNVGGGDGASSAPEVPVAAADASATGIPTVEEPDLAEPGRGGRRWRRSRRGGRQSMSFAISTGSDEAAEGGSSRSRRRHGRRH